MGLSHYLEVVLDVIVSYKAGIRSTDIEIVELLSADSSPCGRSVLVEAVDRYNIWQLRKVLSDPRSVYYQSQTYQTFAQLNSPSIVLVTNGVQPQLFEKIVKVNSCTRAMSKSQCLCNDIRASPGLNVQHIVVGQTIRNFYQMLCA